MPNCRVTVVIEYEDPMPDCRVTVVILLKELSSYTISFGNKPTKLSQLFVSKSRCLWPKSYNIKSQARYNFICK